MTSKATFFKKKMILLLPKGAGISLFCTYDVPDCKNGIRTPSTTTIFFTPLLAKVFLLLGWTAKREAYLTVNENTIELQAVKINRKLWKNVVF